MKILAISSCLMAVSTFTHAYAAPLYPQRAANAPGSNVVRYTAPPAPVMGYDINAGRELRPHLRSKRVAATRVAVPDAPHVVAMPARVQPQPTMQPQAQMQPPADKPIEEQSFSDGVGTAFNEWNTDVNYKGNIEAGMQYSTGNTETQDYNLALELERESGRWVNHLKASLANEESEGEQTEEEYRVSLGSDYKLSKVDFLFASLEYVDDRFSGYDYRIKELAGYGRHWYDDETFGWSSRIGAGYQHFKEIGAERDDSPFGRLENDLRWDITDKLAFENNLQADFSDLTIFRTETALKNQLVGSLFLKFGVVTEYLSDVPAGKENLDIDTMLNLSYEFL